MVTGARGFTGRYFLDAARRAGIAATAFEADITDRGAVNAEVRRLAPSRVLHLAGISYVGHADPRAVYEVNLIGTVHLLDALRDLPEPPQKVIVASSATVYGPGARTPIAETEPAQPTGHYAISKLAMEHAARSCNERLAVVIARAFNYTGPGQSQDFLIPKLVDHFRRGEPCIRLGQLDVEREFNDVRFVCGAYLGLLQHGQAGQTYNICTGRPVTVERMIADLTRLSGHHLTVETESGLVRPNEIKSLFGDPGKLRQTVQSLPDYSTEDTLRWMLGSVD